jgi:molecular chaperone HtpG
MKEGQEYIYYMTATNWEEAVKSPYLEAFRAKEYEVLIMLDEVDDLVINGLSYKNKQLRSILAGDVDLEKTDKADKEESRKRFESLLGHIKEQLKEQVKDVRLSGRLKDSACLLVADEGDLNPQMEKILKAMGQEVPDSKRILEINPDHPLFAAMNDLFQKDRESPALEESVNLLYDQALLLEGGRPRDPASFSRAMARLMVEELRQTH